MALHDKIRWLREMNHWTQDEMAEKMKMSKSGYAKIERGESKVTTEKLEKIAAIFNIDIAELMKTGNSGMFYLISENSSQANYYGYSETLAAEIDKLKLIIQHKDELLKQKDSENEVLKALVAALQSK